MAAKYREYFDMMLKDNKELFENFKDIHDHYTMEPQKYQKVFNQYGQEILDIVQEYENRLCSKSEGGGYGRFSTGLSDKFRAEVKKYLPKINSIGLQSA
ncbi:MAG TPA: hypothetical protein VLE91_04020 [Candidatus Saccharimonadales bacterium]|nr:hypothetical protein [Candidatus Saccharimonadales bacterium]